MSPWRGARARLGRGARWVRARGLVSAIAKTLAVVADPRTPSRAAYAAWRAGRAAPGGGPASPATRISVLVPVHDAEPAWLEALWRSLARQSGARWELCLFDDGSRDPAPAARLGEGDPRVRRGRAASPGGIAAATRAAAAMASGEVLAFVDQDDELAPGVLAALARAFDEDPALDLAYTDEDHLDASGSLSDPAFKPGPSPVLALGFNYVTHLMAVRRGLFKAIGGMAEGCDGAQDHELLLRALERARRARHLPLVGYHWRRVPGSVAASSTNKAWAFEAGLRVVRAAYARRGVRLAALAAHPLVPGVYRARPGARAERFAGDVVLLGGAPAARRWRGVLERARGLRPRAVLVDRWPERAGRGLCVVDARAEPDAEVLARAWDWGAVDPGAPVAIGSAWRGRRADLGWSVRRDGTAEPVLAGLATGRRGPGLLATSTREVAAARPGALFVPPLAPGLAAALGGRLAHPDDTLGLTLAAPAGHPTLFVPHVTLARRVHAVPVRLDRRPWWPAVRAHVDEEVWDGGADRFCPRHPLLVPLGLPAPA